METPLNYRPGERLDSAPVALEDVINAYRLFLGRWPEFDSPDQFRPWLGRSLGELAHVFVHSPEFQARFASGPNLTVMHEAEDGTRLWFNLRDRQALRILMGVHEQGTVEAVRRFLRPGMTCLDIGAHIGMYSILMARSGASVYAFEPFPSTFELLSRNIRENRVDVRAFPLACSDSTGESQIFVPVDDDLGPAFVPTQIGGRGSGIPVQTARADDLVPESAVVGLVKMDIEGGEPRALRGMERILRRDRPVIVTEFNPSCLRHNDGSQPEAFLRQLCAAGYRIYEDAALIAGGEAKEFSYSSETTVNLVCLPVE